MGKLSERKHPFAQWDVAIIPKGDSPRTNSNFEYHTVFAKDVKEKGTLIQNNWDPDWVNPNAPQEQNEPETGMHANATMAAPAIVVDSGTISAGDISISNDGVVSIGGNEMRLQTAEEVINRMVETYLQEASNEESDAQD